MSLQATIDLTLGGLHLDVELEVDGDDAVAVIGPNGAGKTTLLRALAGLVGLDAGRVVIDGTVVEDAAAHVRTDPQQRRLGVVFQEHRLFPNLTALENVAFGLRARGATRAQARAQAAAWLERIGLPDVAKLRPHALSGGQAQRVALARALAIEPAVLLLDEPLAAVDASARAELRHVLRHELGRYPGARLIVTHDPIEAAALADRIIVLEDGRITQRGLLTDVTARPRTLWVATMVGLNLLHGVAGRGAVRVAGGGVVAAASTVEGPAFVAFRPNVVTLHRKAPEGSARNIWLGAADGLYPVGDRVRIRVSGPVPLVAEVTPGAVAELRLADGGPIWATVKATDIDVYPA